MRRIAARMFIIAYLTICVYGCGYQEDLSEDVRCITEENGVSEVRNGRYVARISENTGAFTVHRVSSSGSEALAVTSDSIAVWFQPLPQSFSDANLTGRQVTVEQCYTFYARMRAQGFLPVPSGQLMVTRIYEFTRSSNIYEQLELRYTGGITDLGLREFVWDLGTPDAQRVTSQAITDDLIVQIPDGPLGGINNSLAGHHAPCEPQPDCRQSLSRTIVNPRGELADGTSALLTGFLFSVGLEFQGDLEQGILSQGFREAFENQGISLSCDTTVAREVEVGRWRINDQDQTYLIIREDAVLNIYTDGKILLTNRAISINADTEPAPDFDRYPHRTYQFYPTYGLRGFEKDVEKGIVKYYFNPWNDYKYAMESVVPIPPDEANRQTEDWLIRLTMHLVERLALDEGWFKHYAWSVYPRGDRFATNSRSFPALAYVWAFLTMQKTPQGWQHVAGDGDVIYHQLQEIYDWFVESDPANRSIATPGLNLADRLPSGTPYIAYSAALKERYDQRPSDPCMHEAFDRRPSGVINAHSEPVHFAGLMQEASRLFGDPVREVQWRDIVLRYHLGSKELFQLTYPAAQPAGRILPGLIGYIVGGRQVSNIPPFSIAYSANTFVSFAAGYSEAGEYEPEFADIVERASRLDVDPFDRKTKDAPKDQEDPPDPRIEPCPIVQYVARLARVFPTALAFAMSEEDLPRYFMDGLRINRLCYPEYDQEVNSRWATWNTYPEMKVLAGDFNGDGKTDVMKFDINQDGSKASGGLWVGLSDGSKFNASQWDAEQPWDTYPEMKVLAGDLNGDGKTDVMKFDVPSSGIDQLGLWVGISNGRDFRTTLWSRWDTYTEMKVLAGDFDGDQDMDVMKFDVPSSGINQLGLWVGLSEAFPHDGPDISRDLSAASLLEVLEYDYGREKTVHDPAKFIEELGGRKWILTNTKFMSTWAPGYWEEVDPQNVPGSQLFGIQVSVPPDQTLGHYSAYRAGNKIFIMTDYSGGTLTLELPGSQLPRGVSQLLIKRRTYNENSGRWASEQFVTGVVIRPGPNGKILVPFQQVQRKALTIVEIQP